MKQDTRDLLRFVGGLAVVLILIFGFLFWAFSAKEAAESRKCSEYAEAAGWTGGRWVDGGFAADECWGIDPEGRPGRLY